jgi:choline transport protein
VFAWLFTAATVPATIMNIISGLAIFNYPEYTPERWHQAAIMWALIILPVLFNLYFKKVLDVFEIIGGVGHILFFIIQVVTLVTMGRRSTNDFVFQTLTTGQSGWTNPGVCFGLGLLTVTYPVAGADGLLHMSM